MISVGPGSLEASQGRRWCPQMPKVSSGASYYLQTPLDFFKGLELSKDASRVFKVSRNVHEMCGGVSRCSPSSEGG